ncbi:hypothetical protein SFR_1372 [Streptomyces sp. FR-008]|nr:hypothetical protein SFR_1372 [Streptomyces sp. FR-008]
MAGSSCCGGPSLLRLLHQQGRDMTPTIVDRAADNPDRTPSFVCHPAGTSPPVGTVA